MWKTQTPPSASHSTVRCWTAAEPGLHVFYARRRERKKPHRWGLRAEWGALRAGPLGKTCPVCHPRAVFSWSALELKGQKGSSRPARHQESGIQDRDQRWTLELSLSWGSLPLPPPTRNFRERWVVWAQIVPQVSSQGPVAETTPNPKRGSFLAGLSC